MDLDELRAFIAVVETGSFSAAAKSLRFARATLRRRIDQLEARIGVSLLERDDGRVRPTPAGSLLVEQGAGVLQEARALLESIRALDRNAMQEVHIVGLPGPPSEVMSLGLRTLRAALPNTRQRLSFCEDPVSMLGSATLALDVAETAPEGPFRVRQLAELQVCLRGSKKALAKHPVRTLDDLQEHGLAVWKNREGDLDELRLADGSRVPVAPAVMTSDLSLLEGYARSGAAISYGPVPPAPPGGGSTEIVTVLPELVTSQVNVYLVVANDVERGHFTEFIERLAAFTIAVTTRRR